MEAGDRAARTYATAEAVRWYRRALDIVQTVESPQLARRAYEGLGKALELTSDIQDAVESYRQMREYAQARGDVPMHISALNKLSLVLGTRMWQFAEADRYLSEAEQMARQHADHAGLIELSVVRCGVCIPMANFDSAVSYLGESVDIARELGLKEALVYGLAHLSMTRLYMTEFDGAWQAAEECRRVAEEMGDLAHQAEVMCFPLPMCYLRNGDLETAYRLAGEGVDLARRIGAGFTELYGLMSLGGIAQARGEYDTAISCYRAAFQIAQGLGGYSAVFSSSALAALGSVYLDVSPCLYEQTASSHLEPLNELLQFAGADVMSSMGFGALARGDVDGATQHFERGLTNPSTMWLLQRPVLLVGSAFTRLGRQNVHAASERMREAREYVEQREMRHLYPLLELADGSIHAASGEMDRALEQFTRAEDLASGMGMRPMLWRARATSAKLLAALGRQYEASAKQQAARTMIDEIAGMLDDEQYRAMFVEYAVGQLG